MSYARPSPRPGDIYGHHGPRRPTTGNAYLETGGARPSRTPPHPYPTAGPSYRGASSRQAQRSYDDAELYRPPRHSPRRPHYNDLSSSTSHYEKSDYHRYSPRPSAMTEDRSRNLRNPQNSVRNHDTGHYQAGQPFNRGLPTRGEHRRIPDDQYLDSEDVGQDSRTNYDSQEAPGSWNWDKIKKTVWGNKAAVPGYQSQSSEEDRVPDDSAAGNQGTLWTKLTTVGISFQRKINGEDGYASDASDYQGESHLIRIMKKYHVEKAESAYDLPDWLFTQNELKEAQSRWKEPSPVISHHPGYRPGRYDEYQEEETQYRHGDPAGVGRGRLNDIYDSVDQDRSYSRNGSSAKQSFDSGYGSSSSASRRRGRFDDSRSEFSESKPSLGRNRLAANHDSTARHLGPKAYNPPLPIINNTLSHNNGRYGKGSSDHYSNEPPMFRNGFTRGAPSPSSAYVTPTMVDYSRPSGQDDRYPTPKAAFKRSYA